MSYVSKLYEEARRTGSAGDADSIGDDALGAESCGESHRKLSDFLKSLESRVAALPSAWVVAEVLSADTRGKVLHLELAENDRYGRRVAKVAARLWRNREAILGDFRVVAGEDPKPGMRLLVHARAQVHPAYGLSLDIDRIDGQYTLGDIEKELQKIRRVLREAQLFDRNRHHIYPADFWRVAVISPVGAAALGDFRETADRLENAGLCRFDYHAATFSGTAVADSLVEAMRRVYHAHQAEAYCALCIIRGGGSVTDLAELNQFKIARAICHFPLPVLTGIGHERDNVILDDVASRRFDTPSKLIGHIEQAIHDAARSARADWLHIQSAARRRVETAAREVESLRETVATESRARAYVSASEIEGDWRAITASASAAIPYARQELDDRWREVGEGSRRALVGARRSAAADMENVIGLGPRHTLARGFAVVRDSSGRVVGSRRAANEANRDLTVEFHDGALPMRRLDREA